MTLTFLVGVSGNMELPFTERRKTEEGADF